MGNPPNSNGAREMRDSASVDRNCETARCLMCWRGRILRGADDETAPEAQIILFLVRLWLRLLLLLSLRLIRLRRSARRTVLHPHLMPTRRAAIDHLRWHADASDVFRRSGTTLARRGLAARVVGHWRHRALSPDRVGTLPHEMSRSSRLCKITHRTNQPAFLSRTGPVPGT